MSETSNKPVYAKWWFWVIIAVIAVGIGGAGASFNSEDSKNKSVTVNGRPATEIVEDAAQDAPMGAQEEAVVEEPKDTATTEQKNALKKARSYATRMNMSQRGVYNQLISEYGEGFAPEDAQYAIDNLTDIDWNANALAKGKSYYERMSMSKQGVYDQLISEYGEQFTPEQAQYAIDHLDD